MRYVTVCHAQSSTLCPQWVVSHTEQRGWVSDLKCLKNEWHYVAIGLFMWNHPEEETSDYPHDGNPVKMSQNGLEQVKCHTS